MLLWKSSFEIEGHFVLIRLRTINLRKSCSIILRSNKEINRRGVVTRIRRRVWKTFRHFIDGKKNSFTLQKKQFYINGNLDIYLFKLVPTNKPEESEYNETELKRIKVGPWVTLTYLCIIRSFDPHPKFFSAEATDLLLWRPGPWKMKRN